VSRSRLRRDLIGKRTGDGSIVDFRSVVDAVALRLNVQSATIERNAGLRQRRIGAAAQAVRSAANTRGTIGEKNWLGTPESS
jgi:class 3 adenylate cyclase